VTKGEKDKFVDVLSLFEYFVDLGIFMGRIMKN